MQLAWFDENFFISQGGDVQAASMLRLFAISKSDALTVATWLTVGDASRLDCRFAAASSSCSALEDYAASSVLFCLAQACPPRGERTPTRTQQDRLTSIIIAKISYRPLEGTSMHALFRFAPNAWRLVRWNAIATRIG